MKNLTILLMFVSSSIVFAKECPLQAKAPYYIKDMTVRAPCGYHAHAKQVDVDTVVIEFVKDK